MTVKSKGRTKYDFGGYATKYNVLCTDGRTILPNAFAHEDGQKIPMVWRHFHESPSNVLGHAVLEHREDGIYAYGKFNQTESGQNAKSLVHAGDIDSLSIYANRLVETNLRVRDGKIRELSLVLSGANPGAVIDHLNLQHEDGTEEPIDDEAIIYTDDRLQFEDLFITHEDTEDVDDEEGDDETLGDIFNTMSERQKNVVYAMISEAIDSAKDDMAQSALDEEGENFMKHNIFEGRNGQNNGENQLTLSHDEMHKLTQDVFVDAKRLGSLREAVLVHAGTYGIDDISFLFPDARTVRQTPDLLTRRMKWVSSWMTGVHKTPFSRVKSIYADLTPDAARAKGYTTGDLKIEEVFALLKRTTEPQTVYKKQKLDRDDIIDITDFNVVTWLKAEMRVMLDEEIGRACLIGDGRTFGSDDDAINPEKIRPIYGDSTLYAHMLTLESTVTDPADIIDDIIAARVNYKGTGNPTMYAPESVITSMLLLKDTTGRRIYRTLSELADELRVKEIIEVEVMEGVTRTDVTTRDLLAIIVNPADYTIGADKGGALNFFDDFDIDYNQYKYLLETRISGALTLPKSALVVERQQV